MTRGDSLQFMATRQGMITLEFGKNIEKFTDRNDIPSCVIGDFNSIVSSSEKWGAYDALSNPNRAFRTWINSNGLLDLGHHRPAYTWSNKRQGKACILERLDRVLVTMDWSLIFSEAAVFHLPRFQSDHLPILLRTKPKLIKRKPNFRCEDWWSHRPGFKELCAKATYEGGEDWENTRNSFKHEIRNWEDGFKRPDDMLAEIDKKMKEVLMKDPTPENQEREKRLNTEHIECLRLVAVNERSRYVQKILTGSKGRVSIRQLWETETTNFSTQRLHQGKGGQLFGQFNQKMGIGSLTGKK